MKAALSSSMLLQHDHEMLFSTNCCRSATHCTYHKCIL